MDQYGRQEGMMKANWDGTTTQRTNCAGHECGWYRLKRSGWYIRGKLFHSVFKRMELFSDWKNVIG